MTIKDLTKNKYQVVSNLESMRKAYYLIFLNYFCVQAAGRIDISPNVRVSVIPGLSGSVLSY